MRGSAILFIALLIVLFSLACEADTQRVREANEAAQESQGSSPTAVTLPTPEPKSTLRPKPTPTAMSTTIDVREVRDGDCLRLFGTPNFLELARPRLEDVELVECSGLWEARVLHSFAVDLETSYPGNDYFRGQGAERCDRRSTLYVWPTSESWALGDRTVQCLQERFGQTEPSDNIVSAMSLSSGECFNDVQSSDSTVVELVPCTNANWTFRVLNTFDVSFDGPHPGVAYLQQQVNARCDARWEYSLYPTPESWALGDRKIVCLEQQPQ